MDLFVLSASTIQHIEIVKSVFTINFQHVSVSVMRLPPCNDGIYSTFQLVNAMLQGAQILQSASSMVASVHANLATEEGDVIIVCLGFTET